MSELFHLAQSAVIQAGAGTGKTHSLITLCLHLLAGIGRAEPLAPARLWAVTFTEKAAAELKGRLRERIDRLTALEDPAEVALLEPELSLSPALPGAAHWRRVRRDLGLSQIGTIHGLCGQLLRRHAAAAGVDPNFSMLDENDARRFLAEACENATLEALEGRAGPEREQAARRLCAELNFRGGGRFGRGLAEELAALLSSLGESGRRVSELFTATTGLSARSAAAGDERARAELAFAIDALDFAARAAGGKRGPSVTAQRALDAVAHFRRVGSAALAGTAPGELANAWAALRPTTAQLRKGSGPVAEAAGKAKDALEALLEADAQVRSSALALDLSLLADGALDRYRERKRRSVALDFDDLTRLTRDLLARDLAVRRGEKARLGVLLVDEFQDTSRAQLELFGWLVEGTASEGRAPAGSGLPGAQPVARGALVVVGDRKQSIYEFRGADVAGAQAFAAQVQLDGGQLHLLRESRRSRPALVQLSNALFAAALELSAQPFDTHFTEGEDALTAHRPAGEPGPCAELLDVSGPGVEAEAEVVARRIAALLAPGAPERVRDRDELPRPVRGGDIAVLLRRFTNVETFRRALLARRIPHLVLKGRGFHGAREVLDLVALLDLAADPDDAMALATVLRSPLGPVSDSGLVLLARGPRSSRDGAGQPPRTGQHLERRVLEDEDARAALDPDDAEAVARIASLTRQLAAEVDRLGPAALLEGVLAETDYVACCAGGLYGEQAAANVEKLVSQARVHELRGGSVRSFLAQLRQLAEEEVSEPDAAVVEERDPHAVRLLTVHAAKGLEFPVVFVPECASPVVWPQTGNLAVEPDLGLALKVRGADGKWHWGPHGRAVQDRKQLREAAQSRRLLYVAATRARDLLVFSGRAAPKQESWRSWIDQVLPSCVELGLLRVLPDGGASVTSATARRALVERFPSLLDQLVAAGGRTPAGGLEPAGSLEPQGSPVAAPPPDEGDGAARALVAQITSAGRGAQPTVSAAVTQIADACACPRRYQLLHELRLEERPDHQLERQLGHEPELAPEEREPADPEPADVPDAPDAPDANSDPSVPPPATALGTLAHKLLELAPLNADPGARREALARILEVEGHDPERPEHAEVIEAAVSFLGTPLARRMGAVPAERLQRELPFLLRLVPAQGEPPGPGLLLRGQLDALLLDDGAATVIDYKLSRARDPERYAVQLDAYALAVHALTEGAVPVRTGLVFLRSAGAPFRERPAADAPGLSSIRARLLGAARSLAEGRRTGIWPQVEVPSCRALDCGFLWRCHPEQRPASTKG